MIKRLRRKFILINLLLVGLVLAVVFIRRWKVLDKQYLIGGTVMGFCLFLAYTFQTFGLEQTTSGKLSLIHI